MTTNESLATRTPQELAQKIIIELNRYAIYYVGVMDEYIMERREHEDIIFSRRNRNFTEIWHKLPESLYDEFAGLSIDQQEEVVDYIKDVYPDWRP